MKRYQLLLAYYTLITSLGLFIWSIFFAPKPENFLLTILIIPVSLYFWLLVLGIFKPSHQESDSTQAKDRMKLPLIILMTLFIASFSIFAYSAVTRNSSSGQTTSLLTISAQMSTLKQELKDQNETFHKEIVKELGKMKDQIDNINFAQKGTDATVLGEKNSQVGSVTIKDKKYLAVNVYQEKNLSSKVIGKAEFGKNYTFIESDKSWYLILLTDTTASQDAKEGFIDSQFIKEVQY